MERKEIIDWYNPSEKRPTSMCPLIIDCSKGIGEGYYMGKGIFRFMRFNIDMSKDDVYRWAFMPQHDGDIYR